jgi:molybdate transport system substrate-binding protein
MQRTRLKDFWAGLKRRFFERALSWLTSIAFVRFATALCLSSVLATAHAQPLVAAASDLKFALEEVARVYKADTGQSVRLVFGSSGNFAAQILQGAPFDIFMSADDLLTAKIARAGLSVDAGLQYGTGRLVLYFPKSLGLMPDEQLRSLEQGLKSGAIKRLAIANPEHAPYGARAAQALQAKGLWSLARPSLVLGENLAQAASYVTVGTVQAAILGYSLVLTPPLAQDGHYVLLPESLHEPLKQTMLLLKRADPSAQGFYLFLQQDKARDILKRFGFTALR